MDNCRHLRYINNGYFAEHCWECEACGRRFDGGKRDDLAYVESICEDGKYERCELYRRLHE